jgi:hypothetical protein
MPFALGKTHGCLDFSQDLRKGIAGSESAMGQSRHLNSYRVSPLNPNERTLTRGLYSDNTATGRDRVHDRWANAPNEVETPKKLLSDRWLFR